MGLFDLFDYSQDPTYQTPWGLTPYQDHRAAGAGVSQIGNTLSAMGMAPDWRTVASTLGKGFGTVRSTVDSAREQLLKQNQDQFKMQQDARHNDLVDQALKLNNDINSKKFIDDENLASKLKETAQTDYEDMTRIIDSADLMPQEKSAKKKEAELIFKRMQANPSPAALDDYHKLLETLNTNEVTDAVAQRVLKRDKERAAALGGFASVEDMEKHQGEKRSIEAQKDKAQISNYYLEGQAKIAAAEAAKARAEYYTTGKGLDVGKAILNTMRIVKPVLEDLDIIAQSDAFDAKTKLNRLSLMDKYGIEHDDEGNMSEKGVEQYKYWRKNPEQFATRNLDIAKSIFDPENEISFGGEGASTEQLDPSKLRNIDKELPNYANKSDEELKADLEAAGYPAQYIAYALSKRKK